MSDVKVATSKEQRLELLEKVGKSLLKMPYKSWNFGDSTGFEGILVTGKLLKDPKYFAFAEGWFKAWASRPAPFQRLDCTAPGVAMIEVAQEIKSKEIFDSLVLLAGYLSSRTKDRGIFDTWESLCLIPPYGGEELPKFEAELLANPPGGTCVDCLHFDPPFFTGLGKALNNPAYTDIGVQQAIAYIDALQLESGIFDHFFLNGVPGTWGQGWGRGQGWALLGMLDVLHQIPKTHSGYNKIKEAAEKLIYAMIKLQREDGRWWCVVDSERSGEEGSTAGFMAAGFARAIKLGIVDQNIVKPAMIKALNGVIADADKDGELQNVTAAVMASTRKSHYEFTPRGFSVPWGQGPLALAIYETYELVQANVKTKIARNLPTQIVHDVGSKIVHGEITPGTILTSDILEEKFKVSRTVVREALKVLQDKGLTKARTKTGTIVLERSQWNLLDPDVISWLQVSGLSPELVRDLEEVRASYEPWVARIAAKRRGTKDVADLTNALKKMTDAFYDQGPTSPIIGEADIAFHEALLAATQNELMKRIGKLFIPLLKIRDDMVRHVVEDADFIVQHQAVLDAVIDEDPDGAEIAMKALLETAAQASQSARKHKSR